MYADLLKKHDSCAICGAVWGAEKKPVVDHSHTTKTVRSLLCWSCNIGLGMFKEDPRIIKEALRYMEFWS